MCYSDSRFYLRSLPFIGAILGFLLTLYFFPDAVSAITQYIVNTNPEKSFSPYGWWLYVLVVPCSIAGLSRLEDHWLFIKALVLFPPVLAFSYWLWELLAWVLLAIFFGWILDEGKKSLVLRIAVIIYAVCRVIGCFGNDELLVIGDVLFVTILASYMLVISMIDVFVYDNKFIPSGITLLYVLVLCVSLLCLSNVDKLSTAATKKVTQPTIVSKTIYYCTAKSGVNVRYASTSNSTIVGKLRHGEAVEVLENGTNFTKISYRHSKGETAWVSTKYLSPTKPSITTATSSKTISKKLQNNSSGAKASTSYSSSCSSLNSGTTTVPTKGTHNGYEYVDLGLSVKWATNNMDGHYRFGEKIPIPTERTYDSYKGYTYSFANDVPRANWGGKWRLPTKSEFDELINRCTWTTSTQGGDKGLKVTGPNGNSIFFPAAGYRHESDKSLMKRGKGGYYWSSTHYAGSGRVWILNITYDGLKGYLETSATYGSNGCSIRPVLP